MLFRLKLADGLFNVGDMKKLKAMNSIDMKSRMTVASASNKLNLIKHQTTDATQCDRLMSEAEALLCTNGVAHPSNRAHAS
jgi:hypothetical protein